METDGHRGSRAQELPLVDGGAVKVPSIGPPLDTQACLVDKRQRGRSPMWLRRLDGDIRLHR